MASGDRLRDGHQFAVGLAIAKCILPVLLAAVIHSAVSVRNLLLSALNAHATASYASGRVIAGMGISKPGSKWGELRNVTSVSHLYRSLSKVLAAFAQYGQYGLAARHTMLKSFHAL